VINTWGVTKVTLHDVEVESIPSSARQMQSQMENLISIVKLLVLVLGGLLVIGIMYLVK
jgi:hydroxymethylglutaryl-CoA reductase